MTNPVAGEYLDLEAARARRGLRLVLSRGVPGPWGEAAKNIFHLKGLDYARVSQFPGQPNDALYDWTGQRSAPVAIYDDEPLCTTWFSILLLAERLAATPRLIPETEAERALMFGLAYEICGEDGFGWNRRLLIMAAWDRVGTEADAARRQTMKSRYGYSEAAQQRAATRVVEVLGLLSSRLHEQAKLGRRCFIGGTITAVDIYAAAFSALLQPLPPSLCPMPEGLREFYTARDPRVVAAIDPMLLAHRDWMYAEHLALPLDL